MVPEQSYLTVVQVIGLRGSPHSFAEIARKMAAASDVGDDEILTDGECSVFSFQCWESGRKSAFAGPERAG